MLESVGLCMYLRTDGWPHRNRSGRKKSMKLSLADVLHLGKLVQLALTDEEKSFSAISFPRSSAAPGDCNNWTLVTFPPRPLCCP
jgi:hypothetical protein